MSQIENVVEYFRAGYGAVSISTDEEVRFVREIERLARENEADLWVCSITEGMIRVAGTGENGHGAVQKIDKRDVIDIYDEIMSRKTQSKEWFVLLDLDDYAGEPVVQRKMRDMLHKLPSTTRRVIFLQPAWKLPRKLEREVTIMNIGLPGPEELRGVLDRTIGTYRDAIAEKRKRRQPVDPFEFPEGDEQLSNLVEAARGMTMFEAENAYSLSAQKKRAFDVQLVADEKLAVIRKSGLLELYPTLDGMERVGGHDVLKKWLKRRRRAFDQGARDYKLKMPKGAIMIGPPGTGKSLVSKCVAASWGMVLLRLDMGAVFEGTVGASESNMRRVIEIVDSLGRCVLWMDEIDKGLASPTGKVLSGGEVTKHVIGTLITWLQEKTTPVFVIATCNDIQSLPPELLRAGRFDKIWFADLPTVGERDEIGRILVGKVGRDAAAFDTRRIAERSPGFTGSEIERCIDEAMNIAFDEDREVVTDDIVRAVNEFVPLSRTAAQEIERLREWAKGKATWTSSVPSEALVSAARAVEV